MGLRIPFTRKEQVMIELKQEQTAPIPNEMLMRVIQINEAIVRQNGLIIQVLTVGTMPTFIKKEKNT